MARSRSRGTRRSSARALSSLASLLDLAPIADLRMWHPDPSRPATLVDGRLARITIVRPRIASGVRIGVRARSRALPSRFKYAVGEPLTSSKLPTGTRFEAPRRVVLCVRRKSRREVIFARRKAGAGARSRKRRRSWRSDIAC